MNALLIIIICTVLLAWKAIGDARRVSVCYGVVSVVSVVLTKLNNLITRSKHV